MGCTCSLEMYAWQKSEKTLPTKKYQLILDKRRNELLEKLQLFEDSDDYSKEIVDEWVALTKERDVALKHANAEENQILVDDALVQLQYWLHFIVSDKNLRQLLSKGLAVDLTRSCKNLSEELKSRGIVPEKQEEILLRIRGLPSDSDHLNMSPVPPLRSSSPLKEFRCPAKPRQSAVTDVSEKVDDVFLSSTDFCNGKSEVDGDGYRTPMSSNSVDTFDSALSSRQNPAFRAAYCRLFPSMLNTPLVSLSRDTTEHTFHEEPEIKEERKLDSSID